MSAMTAENPDQGRDTILLVDDERDILVALTDLLDEDYRVISSTSAREALKMLESEPDVAVIISDQRMPEMAGNVFLAEARRKCAAESLLVTGYADIDAVISAVNDGQILGYVHKPWEPEALRAMVAAAVGRHRLKRRLAFERAIVEALADRSSDHIAVLDAGGRTIRTNRPGAAAFDEQDAAVLAGAEAQESEEERVDADGAMRWIRVQRIPFVAEGSAPHLLKIESDQTQRRLLEHRLFQAEKLQALGTLAGGIAHDFNNLLTAVLGNLELAARRADDDDDRLARLIANATEAANRGASLTRRLLSFTRQRDLTATVVDPNALVRGMEELIDRTLGGMTTVCYHLSRDVGQVRVDEDQLELALLNLAINARDAMPGNGEIRISTDCRRIGQGHATGLPGGDYVRIQVADDGEGMSAEVLGRAFEPFFTTKKAGRGTGLGLPMVYAMARAVGGAVTIDSRIGAGTTVTIWLPCVREEAAPAATEVMPPPAPALRPLRLLLAEDDETVRSVVVAYIEDMDHELLVASSGGEALALLDEGAEVDLLITDFAMPGMSGIELAEAAVARRPGLRVLLVTGFAEIGTLPPYVDVLPKPFDAMDLARALDAAVKS